jgi:hypothetical protein
MRFLQRAAFRIDSWLSRRALQRDPAYRYLDAELTKARKRHAPSAHLQAAKRDLMHTALGWRGQAVRR